MDNDGALDHEWMIYVQRKVRTVRTSIVPTDFPSFSGYNFKLGTIVSVPTFPSLIVTTTSSHSLATRAAARAASLLLVDSGFINIQEAKPWENHRKTIGKSWFSGILWDIPSDNQTWQLEIHWKWGFQ